MVPLQLLLRDGVCPLTFAWITFSCASALIGFWRILTGRRTGAPTTAGSGAMQIVIPVFNEDPDTVFAMLEDTPGFELAAEGAAEDFDIFRATASCMASSGCASASRAGSTCATGGGWRTATARPGFFANWVTVGRGLRSH